MGCPSKRVTTGLCGSALLRDIDLALQLIAAVVGALALGLMFAGWLDWGLGTFRLPTAPRLGVATAPLLGIVFGLGWTPCISPALSVVLSLALNEATALRGGVLALACCRSRRAPTTPPRR